MQNGYFQLVSAPGGGYGVKFFPPQEEGEKLGIGEVVTWLDTQHITYDLGSLKEFLDSGKEIICLLGKGDCPVINETYQLTISEDCMLATVRFYPPSEGGQRISFNEFLSDLRYKNITSGIQMTCLQDHFQSDGVYCTDLLVAQGREPRQGKDARIEYFFNTNLKVHPTVRDDGSVDYYNLNVINHCKQGDLLAKIIPADEGEYGMNIMGARIKPREVKKESLKFGNYVELSKDKMSITSMVDGHVMLVDDKVVVSDVYTVENVDISTGNIIFNGSVQVNGNVASNFTVKATGNVFVNGVVEGANIMAGGNIIIARGMNGMAKGSLHAGGNVVAKFIESATVVAEQGYVNTESILHSDVQAGDEIVVNGKKGFVTGGHVQAANKISVKTLGAEMGAPTVVEVGVNPQLKDEYVGLQRQVYNLKKQIKDAEPILTNFAEKHARGVHFTPEQFKYIKDTAKSLEVDKQLLVQKKNELDALHEIFAAQRKAIVEVTGEVYPGTTIIIGDASMVVQNGYRYCKFERVQGEVKLAPL
jgi:hypothetical protein